MFYFAVLFYILEIKLSLRQSFTSYHDKANTVDISDQINIQKQNDKDDLFSYLSNLNVTIKINPHLLANLTELSSYLSNQKVQSL